MPTQALQVLDAAHTPSLEEVQRHYMFATSQVQKQWRRMVDKMLTPLGLTQALWLPLMHLHHAAAPLRQKDLAFSLALDNSSVVRLVDGLMAQGWVEAVADADRRVKRIQLTAAGQAQAEQVNQVLAQARTHILSVVPTEDLHTAFTTMQRLLQAMGSFEEAQETSDSA
ncbi:MAG: MarR family transcriptional regulator [Comamonas sp.]